jgi:serine/threonine protein kinase
MGIVYQARDRETNEIVALKFLKPEIATDAQILERFRNEVRLSRKISHRNVARLHELHRTGDAIYVSMEYVEGESLRALLQREAKLPLDRGLEIARQLIAGLSEAHSQTIVHRDLKPENIMIKPSGEVKVMDFGISRSYAAGVTSTGAIIGTPAYMAPEQAEGKPTDHRTDIYALGLILYEMFTGAAAFSGETPVSVALKQIRELPPAPRMIAPGLPAYVETAILKCLEKDPAQRFQSVEELRSALSQETFVRTPSKLPSRRRWWIAGAAVAGVVAAIAVALWISRQPSDSLRFPIERFTLANGMPVVMSVDRSAPVFTFLVSYKAGTRSDPIGKSGLALTVAHLMQQGSENVGPQEQEALISQFGGDHTYGVYQDSSSFASTLPSSQLEMALYLEADRMRSLQITPAGMDSVRSYVKEQHAELISRPYGKPLSRIVELTFSNPVNQRGFTGPPEEIDSITLDDAKEFYKKYYLPSNASLVLVGDFDPAKARDLIKHYFENIPAGTAPPIPNSSEGPPRVERRETMTDPTAKVPVVLLCWPAASFSLKDWIALKALADLLWGSPAARLPVSLVNGAGIASSIEGDFGTSRGPNYFWVALVAVPGKDLGQLERMALQEIDRIVREGVPEPEMEQIRMSRLRKRATEFVTSSARAIAWGQLMSFGSDPGVLNEMEKSAQQVTGDELRRVAKEYLGANRAVIVVNPGGSK